MERSAQDLLPSQRRSPPVVLDLKMFVTPVTDSDVLACADAP
jgi:hypothetical protein